MSAMDPTGSEIQQSEIPEFPAVLVKIETPVRVQQMGAVFWNTRRYQIDNTAWIKIASANPRRSRMLVTVRTQVGYLADQPGASTADLGRGSVMPSPSTIELRHTQDVWFIGSAGAASEVGVIEEYWAN